MYCEYVWVVVLGGRFGSEIPPNPKDESSPIESNVRPSRHSAIGRSRRDPRRPTRPDATAPAPLPRPSARPADCGCMDMRHLPVVAELDGEIPAPRPAMASPGCSRLRPDRAVTRTTGGTHLVIGPHDRGVARTIRPTRITALDREMLRLHRTRRPGGAIVTVQDLPLGVGNR